MNKYIALYLVLFGISYMLSGQDSEYYFSKKCYTSGIDDSIPILLTTHYDSTITIIYGDETDTASFIKKGGYVVYKSESSESLYSIKYNTETYRLKVKKTSIRDDRPSVYFKLLNYGTYSHSISWDDLNEKQVNNMRAIAYKFYDCGKPSYFVSIMREIMPRFPGNTEDYYIQGTVLYDYGMEKEAKQAYENYIVYSSRNGDDSSNVVQVRETLGKHKVHALAHKYTSESKLKKKEGRDLRAFQRQKEGRLIECYYVDERGKKLHRVHRNQIVYAVLISKNMYGHFIDIDFHDDSVIYEYQGRELTERMIENIPVFSDKMKIELKAIKQAEKIVF